MKHCLVVDDSRVIRKVACRILQDLHFETGEAEDGASALAACRSQMPELILLDLNMPNMDSIEFLKTVRREHGGDRPVIVFCMTENDVASVSEAISAGADEYIMKPFDRGVIEAKLAEVGLA
jgi:two-component system, chemotaxis family, chemotaxis protein CheY